MRQIYTRKRCDRLRRSHRFLVTVSCFLLRHSWFYCANFLIFEKCSVSAAAQLSFSPPQVLGGRTWWTTCSRRALTCTRGMTAVWSLSTTPARSATPRWGGVDVVTCVLGAGLRQVRYSSGVKFELFVLDYLRFMQLCSSTSPQFVVVKLKTVFFLSSLIFFRFSHENNTNILYIQRYIQCYISAKTRGK